MFFSKVTSNAYLRKVLRLSIPMAVTELITLGSGFLCMVMLADLGKEVLAASALIFSLSISILVIFVSLFFSLSILVGHAFGKGDYLDIGSLWQQGGLLSVIISLPAMLIYWNIYPILIYFGQDESISLIVKEFFQINLWRVLPVFLAVCNQQLCYGVHKQKIDMIANILGVFVLVISAYLLIFGKWGLPALGVTGFAYASLFQALFYFSFTTLALYFIPDFKRYDLFHIHLHQYKHTIKKLIKVGWPISLQISGEMLSFLIGTVFVGWLGTHSLAAYQIVIQYQFLIVIPIFAISQATGILVGQAYGSKQFIDIKKLVYASFLVAMVTSGFGVLIFIFFPKLLASLYIDIHAQNNLTILNITIKLFLASAVSQFLAAIRNTLTGALRGMLDTRFPMIVGLMDIWLAAIPLAYWFAFILNFGAVGVILGWICGMAMGVIILYFRWRAMSSTILSNSE